MYIKQIYLSKKYISDNPNQVLGKGKIEYYIINNFGDKLQDRRPLYKYGICVSLNFGGGLREEITLGELSSKLEEVVDILDKLSANKVLPANVTEVICDILP